MAQLNAAGRGRAAVAASLLAVLLIAGYFAASGREPPATPGAYLLNGAILGVAFWFPALRIGSVRDMVRQWRPLAVWLVAWTLVWDLATSGLFDDRELLEDWWVVYPSGVAVVGALLALHGVIVARVDAGTAGRGRGVD